jgi:hypothetical protein
MVLSDAMITVISNAMDMSGVGRILILMVAVV